MMTIDKSVLEMHHISLTFSILMQKKYSFLEDLTAAEYKSMRDMLVTMVLATDMSQHFSELNRLKIRLASKDWDPKKADKTFVMSLIIHASDISNPTRKYKIYENWTHRILNEFFKQGDKERAAGMTCTFLMDRYTTNIAKSQLGFIGSLALPFFEPLSQFIPEMSQVISNINSNKKKWEDRVEEFEIRLKLLNSDKERRSLMSPPGSPKRKRTINFE